jgi:chemotaxis response regulator CheB
MIITCVLVMKQDSLLNRALASALLRSDCEIKIIPSSASDAKGLIAETSKFKPDIVIIGESMPLARKDALGSLLMSYPEMRVVVVSEDTNWLHIFHKTDKLMTRQADLLDVLCL